MKHEEIIERSLEVLALNDKGEYSVPNYQIFGRSQFAWDSCIVAMAHAYHDTDRAKKEIYSLFRGQHNSGMIPNETIESSTIGQRIIFGTERSSNGITTSGITQPPLIAQAVLDIGNHISDEAERVHFFKRTFGPLKNYHAWLLRERVVDDTGLVTLLHPYESGMDNTPPWRNMLHEHWLEDNPIGQQAGQVALKKIIGGYRRLFADTRYVPEHERADNDDVLSGFLQTRAIARHQYDMRRIWAKTDIPLQQDVGFNAVFAEANQSLLLISAAIDDPEYSVEEDLLTKMNKLNRSIESELWYEDLYDSSATGFYNRDARTGELTDVNTVAGLLPLVTDLADARRDFLVDRLFDPDQFWTSTPIPSVAINDPEFHETAYWRGVSWPFPRVILERALTKHGLDAEASELRQRTLRRESEPHKSEYDHPFTGEAMGTIHFAPTAGQDIIFAHKEKEHKVKIQKH